ncbi:MAG: YfhO family protein [Anaerolineae bacterium]
MRLRRLITPDTLALTVLVVLWLLFFWRLFTPIEADQRSLKKGDFSGQFVAFAAYQYERFAAREVPLWNPYNNGGLPFIGDTQAAVFYPPRLVTLFLCGLGNGFSYHALELEMTFHVLACSLFMYILVRRITLGQAGSVFGAFVAAVIASYGGFLQSYPPLQLALLEAAIWLPLAVLGIHEATRDEHIKWRWLLLTALAYGLSWMAGHPQTTWFLTYLLAAYVVYRGYIRRYRWTVVVRSIIAFGLLGGGLAAVQLLPGFEYLLHTARTGLSFDAKGNGFPFQDMVQFIFPGTVSQWSPLYVGLLGLTLALIAVWRRLPGGIFWGIVVLAALGLSFGDNSPIYSLLYNPLPGLRFFRGQERAAYLVSFGLSILGGMGASHIISWDRLQDYKATEQLRRALLGLAILCGIFFGGILLLWMGNHDAYNSYIQQSAFSFISASLSLVLVGWLIKKPQHLSRMWLVGGLLVLELFTVSMDKDTNYDSLPPQEQVSVSPPTLVKDVLADTDNPFRVDGYRVLGDNYGSFYNVMDMRGISPLFLEGPNTLINADLINPRAWELFAVRYVYTDWEQMPVASKIIGSGEDRYGKVNLHQLSNPRPFAQLIYDVRVAEDDATALQLTTDPNINLRNTIIVKALDFDAVPGQRDEDDSASVTTFEPEFITINTHTSNSAVLSIALPDYPGWNALIDGQPVPILRAYGALMAIPLTAGDHTVRLVYDPASYKVGLMISVLAWATVVVGGGLVMIRRRNNALA